MQKHCQRLLLWIYYAAILDPALQTQTRKSSLVYTPTQTHPSRSSPVNTTSPEDKEAVFEKTSQKTLSKLLVIYSQIQPRSTKFIDLFPFQIHPPKILLGSWSFRQKLLGHFVFYQKTSRVKSSMAPTRWRSPVAVDKGISGFRQKQSLHSMTRSSYIRSSITST